MKASIVTKLEILSERLEEVTSLLSDAGVIADSQRFRSLSQEYAELEPVVSRFADYGHAVTDIESAEQMLSDDDSEMKALAAEELLEAQQRKNEIEQHIKMLLIPKDPADQGNVYLEIRAGAGGDEAALFAADLFRMYGRYAEQQHWRVEILSEHISEIGGYKEVICRVVGHNVYSRLKFESGGHRVQRVPETESQGRVHTSACTVAILPELDEIQAIEINPAELRIDTYRASGAGGQHVNKTDSAIRITHLPTGTVVECQDERSQHKNRARAMSLLKSRLLASEREQQTAQQASTRKLLVGSGDRSQRIRTYNFPQGRVTDHRINLTLYKLDDVLQGHLDQVITPLTSEDQAEQLAALGE